MFANKALTLGALAVAWALSMIAVSKAEEFDGPSFRKGMWQFERTLERTAAVPHLPSATFLVKQQMLRCVDPTEAMKETFKPTSVGNCHSTKAEKVDNTYVFALRCDYMGPVKTVISVESDAAYTETNEVSVGHFPRKETVIARRVGDCENEATAVRAAAHNSTRYGVSLGSRRVSPSQISDAAAPAPAAGAVNNSRSVNYDASGGN